MDFHQRSVPVQDLIESLPGVLYVLDEKARLLLWNRHLETLLGYSTEQIRQMQPLQLIAVDHRERVAAGVAEVFAKGIAEGEADLQRHDGTRVRHYFTGRRSRRAGRTCVIGMGINVIDQPWVHKRSGTELQQSDVLYRNVHATVIFHLSLDSSGQFRFLTISDEFIDVTGLSELQVLGELLQQVIPHRHSRAALSHCRTAIHERRTVRWLERSAYLVGRREYGEVTVTPLFNSRGDCTSLVVSCGDVTGEIDAAEDLHASESMKSAIIESAMDCIITIDAESRVIEFNPAAEQTFGITRADILGKPMDEYLIPPAFREQHRQGLRRYLQTGRSNLMGRRVELTAMRISGEEFPVEATFARLNHGRQALFTSFLRDISRRKRSEAQLHKLAYYDALTGLPNRARFTELLQQSLNAAIREDRVVGIAVLDLDRFKRINDSLGHGVGDLLLKAVAERLIGAVRQVDTVARLSGDEFALILMDVDRARGVRAAQTILDCLSQPFKLAGHELHITGSLGLTLSPTDDKVVENLLRNADIALYRAKERAGNSYEFYAPDMAARADAHFSLERALHRALEQGEFHLEYQPIIDLNDGSIRGSEALLRWHHAEASVVRLEDLIRMAEDCGLIGRLGEWILHQACTQWREGPPAAARALSVAVNISPRQLQQDGLLKSVTRILEETDFDPRRLDLEITETSLVRNTEQVLRTMHKLGALNVQFSVDDFGTGYSNFGYLKTLPIGSVKIDRSFISDIATNSNSAAIARAVLAMAHSLNLQVIAEGVETREQLTFLRDNGCDAAQGYYFSRPLRLEQFSELMASPPQWF